MKRKLWDPGMVAFGFGGLPSRTQSLSVLEATREGPETGSAYLGYSVCRLGPQKVWERQPCGARLLASPLCRRQRW